MLYGTVRRAMRLAMDATHGVVGDRWTLTVSDLGFGLMLSNGNESWAINSTDADDMTGQIVDIIRDNSEPRDDDEEEPLQWWPADQADEDDMACQVLDLLNDDEETPRD